MARTIDIRNITDKDGVATRIADLYTSWESYRTKWIDARKEIREYLFATDTSFTSNGQLPWKNRTHIPKLTQIRDNLHANYMAALFPNDSFLSWEGSSSEAETETKRRTIQFYMRNKLRLSDFRTTVSQLVLDWIDYGNCFAMPVYVTEVHDDPLTGEKIPSYVGPKLQRISPLDIVFDPTVADFADSPKIIRTLRTLGSLAADIQDKPEMKYLQAAFDRAVENRRTITANYRQSDFTKNSSLYVDGFSSFFHYLQSDLVEELHFYGDFYDVETNKLYKNYLISVIDRSFVVRMTPNDSWFGKPQIFHCGWRQRSDNLYAMGPLDNLVGMQYRINHLENCKADAWDQFTFPMIKVKGAVEDFEYAPGERIYMDADGDIEFERPDATFMSANTEIAMYEMKMEEFAGAPKEAMGFRTPGEKTKYEVQVLENGANRIFLNKISYFEEKFIEPIVNSMLELARRNLDRRDTIRILDEQVGAVIFQDITKEDITARGKIRPVGARHFVTQANVLQNLTNLYNSPLGQDPAVLNHISGKNMAKLLEYLLNVEQYGLVKENVRLEEQAESQQMGAALQQQVMETTGPQIPDGVPGGFQGRGGAA